MEHGGKGVGGCCIAFLYCMDVFAGLGEDVRVLRGREDRVEAGFVEAFADLEDGLGGGRSGEGELVGSGAYYGAVLLVQGDVVLLGLASPR